MRGMFIIFGVLLAVVLIALLVLFTSKPAPAPPPKAPEPTKEQLETDTRYCLVLDDSRASFNDFSTTILGIVRNACTRDLKEIRISFKLYDRDGKEAGSASATWPGLAKNETWTFRAQSFEVAPKYKLDELTAK